MLDSLYQMAIEGGGIWCVLCIYLIICQKRKYDELEAWVKEEVITAIRASTEVMKDIKERMDADRK